MALFNKLNSSFSNLRLWEINETEDELRNNLNLSESSNSKFDKLKSQSHRKQFLSVQNLLKLLNIKNDDLFYNSKGKPELKSGKFIVFGFVYAFARIL